MIAIETQIRLYSSALLSCAPDYRVTWTTRLRPAPKFHSERALTRRQTQEDWGFKRCNTHLLDSQACATDYFKGYWI